MIKPTDLQKQQVKQILGDNVEHYRLMVAAGKAALGTSKYPDARDGLAALDKPNSNAAKFRDWRKQSNAENDQTLIDSFKKADAYFNADNEPTAITSWRDDMSTMTTLLVMWVQTAQDWLITQKSDADLASAAAAVDGALATASNDVEDTIAKS